MLYIFGGYGYIGSGLRNELERRQLTYLSPTRLEVDLSDLKSISNWLTKVKAKPEPDDSVIYLVSNAKRSDWSNSDIHIPAVHLRNLFSIFQDCHFIYTSSVDIYGTPRILPITENSPISIESPYALSKLGAEETLFQHLRPARYLVLRLPGIYGGSDPRVSVLNKFVFSLINQEKVKIRNMQVLKLQRDWIYKEDFIAAILRMAEEKACGVFNFVSGSSRTIDWWIRTLATELSLPLHYEIEAIDKDDQGFDLTFNADKLRTEFSWLTFSHLSITSFLDNSADL